MYTDNDIRALRDRVLKTLTEHRVGPFLVDDIRKEFDAIIGEREPVRQATGVEQYHLSKINRYNSRQNINLTTLWVIPVPRDDGAIFRWLTVLRGSRAVGYLVRSPRGVLMKDIRDELNDRGFEWFSSHSRLGHVIHQNQLGAIKYTTDLQIHVPSILVNGAMENGQIIFTEAYGLYIPKPIKFGRTTL